ncbi:hypothetical protein L0Z11_16255 [Burkholderia multivorans]|uniref:hypothetical protein n=1 Tax=Burkholderia multivorans TaxID=87883 RepID=UPI0020198EE8|nr:hypothetical protein [Burkholderia multivorans]UQN69189.1 hypothetical protein L0Z45_16275 [Burkholderia multivorans]UQN74917.1 hypothetical protein L0Z11_16255 [Burkholderia multivorans]
MYHETRTATASGAWKDVHAPAAPRAGTGADVLALARCIEPDPAAVWAWFVGTPIHPYGRTAMELVQAGQGDAVLAFLRRALRDLAEAAAAPPMRSLSVW